MNYIINFMWANPFFSYFIVFLIGGTCLWLEDDCKTAKVLKWVVFIFLWMLLIYTYF